MDVGWWFNRKIQLIHFPKDSSIPSNLSPWVATTAAFQNTLLLSLGHRALRDLPRCTVRGKGERGGFNTGGGAGLITAGLTVRAGQSRRPAGTATLGAGRANEEGEKPRIRW